MSELKIPLTEPGEWEPLSPLAPRTLTKNQSDAYEKQWAECEGYEILRSEILRYCKGAIQGQSFLVAGHRGAGKTLLTHLAIQVNRWHVAELWSSSLAGKATLPNPTIKPAFPMLVPLHGPDLLAGGGSTWTKELDENGLAAHAMKQIVLSLERAFREELIEGFQKSNKPPRQHDLVELIRDLQGKVTAPGILRHWERLGVIDTGSLGRGTDVHEEPAQGLAEATLLEMLAYSADSVESEKSKREGFGLQIQTPTGPLQMPFGQITKYWRLLAPLLSFGTAVVAVASLQSVLLNNSSQTAKALIWAMTPIVFYISLFLGKRLFLSDDDGGPSRSILESPSLLDLDRALPVLVNRLYTAGYAPIFVVDELDKVTNLDNRLRAFMRQLKYFATDQAFFCFLTDRQYFEVFEAEIKLAHYPVEKTYFGHRILVYYKPQAVKDYLRKRLNHSKDINPDALSPEASNQIQRILFEKIALFKCHFHPDDLNQYLRASSKVLEQGRLISIDDDNLWTVPGYRLDLFCNAVLRFLYDSRPVQLRLRQNGNFSAWVLDALYFPVYKWAEAVDASPMEISAEGLRRHFSDHTSSRGRREAATPSRDVIADSDLRFLFDLTRQFVDAMAHPSYFARRFIAELTKATPSSERDDQTLGTFLDLLAISLQTSILEIAPSDSLVGTTGLTKISIIWRFDPRGNSLNASESMKNDHSIQFIDAISQNDFARNKGLCYRDTLKAIDYLGKIKIEENEVLSSSLVRMKEIEPILNKMKHLELRTILGLEVNCDDPSKLLRLSLFDAAFRSSSGGRFVHEILLEFKSVLPREIQDKLEQIKYASSSLTFDPSQTESAFETALHRAISTGDPSIRLDGLRSLVAFIDSQSLTAAAAGV